MSSYITLASLSSYLGSRDSGCFSTTISNI